MRAFILAAGLLCAWCAAQADTISTTTPVPPTGYDAYGGYGFAVDTPEFDTALGTLDSVSVTVSGSVQDSIFGFSGDTVPFAALFNNVGTIDGYGLGQSVVLSQDSGTASTFLASNSFAVDLTVSTTQDLAAYATGAMIATAYMFYSTVSDTATGQHHAKLLLYGGSRAGAGLDRGVGTRPAGGHRPGTAPARLSAIIGARVERIRARRGRAGRCTPACAGPHTQRRCHT
jgi:hypothetical protein